MVNQKKYTLCTQPHAVYMVALITCLGSDMDRKYCRYGLAFLVINLTLDKLQPAAVKEIPIILI